MIVEYYKTKNQYEIIGTALMKDPSTGDWKDCIIYRQYKMSSGELVPEQERMTFVREKTDFDNKFKEV